MRVLWLAALMAPLAAGSFSWHQPMAVDAAGQASLAPFSGGDAGTATIGASQASASVSVSDVAIQVADDVLDMAIEQAPWQGNLEYVSHTGFGGLLTSITISLRQSGTTETSIRIVNGAPTIMDGDALALATGAEAEVVAAASLGAAGTVAMQLVLVQGGVEIRQDITIQVT